MSLLWFALHHLLQLGTATQRLQPFTVDYTQFEVNPELVMANFAHAMHNDGIVQMVSVPGYSVSRKETLVRAQACLSQAPNAQLFQFSDGTSRRTLAAASGESMGHQDFDHGSYDEACHSLQNTSLFRKAIEVSTDAFVKLLSSLVDPKMNSQSYSSHQSVAEAVRQGDRLEHFHSYETMKNVEAPTIDFHVDHGMFIAFAPAMMMDGELPSPTSAGDFLIKRPNGEVVEVELRDDAVVFMLGDSLNQMLMKCPMSRALHVPSHAVRMPFDSIGMHRVWYGLMQLPPSNSLTMKGLPYGDQRRKIVQVITKEPAISEDVLAWGCTGGRRLRALATDCDNSTQKYCWAQCLDFTPSVSPSACASQNGLQMQCVDQFDQVRDPSKHGDIWLVCSNSSKSYEPRPQVKQPLGCGMDDWMVEVNDPAYTNRTNLSSETYFLWTSDNGVLKAKMVHKGSAGWLGFGLANKSDTSLEGMLGGKVVLGLNDPVNGSTVNEYHIHYKKSGFRWWNKPQNPSALKNAALKVSNCSISLLFETSSIYGEKLDFSTSGSNSFIWALTHLDYPTTDAGGYAGYHSDPTWQQPTSMFRGHVTLNLRSTRTNQLSSQAAQLAIFSNVLFLFYFAGQV